MNTYKIINGKLVLKDKILKNHHLIVEEGLISQIVPETHSQANMEEVDAQGLFVTPAFVELHIHGCSRFGFDQTDSLDMDEVIRFLKERGINTFVPTFQCDREVIKKFSNLLSGSPLWQKSMPGIYIEGPFINPEKRGGILAETITLPNVDELKAILKETGGFLKLMTIAPEMEGNLEVYHHLIEDGVVPCFGHANTRIDEVFPVGGNKVSITHLFNAMSPVSHKQAGLAMLPFLNRDVYFELNADGVHLNDEVLKMCYRNLNHDRLILTSDAVPSAGLQPGEYESYGHTIVSGERGVRYKKNDVLMGSNLLMNEIFKRFIQLTGASLPEGIRFASYNACKLLGIDHKRGSIETGKEAYLLLLDDELNVKKNLG